MKKKWWHEKIGYQIYPKSFLDTNGDGVGDLTGVIEKLPYLEQLGVDILWLSPVYPSPMVDNGYDISDYENIDPRFGTLEDMDRLIAEAKKKNISIIMDLVVNHCSDQHAWFRKAIADPKGPYGDYFYLKEGKDGKEPNNWRSYFGGSVWEKLPGQDNLYYYHAYAKQQPDLNWENPALREEIYKMVNWWLDRGVDGFRMDVITLISKRTDLSGKLPGEYGSELDDLPVGEEGYSNPNPFCADGPRQDEFLAEMRREVFEGREGFLTVGEAPGVTAQRNEYITDPANGELDMLFLFEHVDFDCEGVKWKPLPLDLPKLKSIMAGYQAAVKNAGWASLFTGNHDQPRVVSRWGDDSSEESRVRSAKALGLMLHMHRGTPYIYQGEELGMTDAHFTRLDQYRDLESLNAYRQRVEEAKVQSSESMMAGLAARSRDNARTPMQWDGSGYAGFTAPDAATEPWISVNPNHAEINAAGEFDDPDSVYSFYKQLVALRHNSPVVAAGDWRLIDAADPHVYAFTRELDAEKLLVVVNMSSRTVDLPREAAELTAVGIAEPNVVISTYDAPHTVASLANRELDPWEAAVIQL
mgnify:CR=1 FL=1